MSVGGGYTAVESILGKTEKRYWPQGGYNMTLAELVQGARAHRAAQLQRYRDAVAATVAAVRRRDPKVLYMLSSSPGAVRMHGRAGDELRREWGTLLRSHKMNAIPGVNNRWGDEHFLMHEIANNPAYTQAALRLAVKGVLAEAREYVASEMRSLVPKDMALDVIKHQAPPLSFWNRLRGRRRQRYLPTPQQLAERDRAVLARRRGAQQGKAAQKKRGAKV
jgi:hypothetical protein